MRRLLLSAMASLFFASMLPIQGYAATGDSYLNISPVVQLISYQSDYGKYVEMMGW